GGGDGASVSVFSVSVSVSVFSVSVSLSSPNIVSIIESSKPFSVEYFVGGIKYQSVGVKPLKSSGLNSLSLVINSLSTLCLSGVSLVARRPSEEFIVIY